MTLQDADTRLRAVVDLAFGGVHHVGKITKYEDGSPPMWSFTVSEGLSTFDASALTRLVVAAHDQCVRVSIYPGGPRRLKVWLHVRPGRDGNYASHRHPTMETAIATARKIAWQMTT